MGAKNRGTPEDEKALRAGRKGSVAGLQAGKPKAAPYGLVATQVLVILGLTDEPNLPLAFICYWPVSTFCEWQQSTRSDGQSEQVTYASAALSSADIHSMRVAISSSLSEPERYFPGVGKADAVASHQRKCRAQVLVTSATCVLRAKASSICSAIVGLTLE